MRTAPTIDVSAVGDFDVFTTGANICTNMQAGNDTSDAYGITCTNLVATTSGLTAGDACLIQMDGVGTRYLAMDAEL
jgi:hypothetical protein